VVQNVEVMFLKVTASVREASSISALWKVWESFENRKAKQKSFDLRHILLPIDLMINLISFCFRAEIKTFF
jgi:hypothetical protein